MFLLALDAKPDSGSLSDAWCEAAGINERIPVKVLSEKETHEILEANRDRAYDLFRVYMKGDRRMCRSREFKVEDKRWRELPVVAVRCAQRLPAGAEVELVLGPNVKTTTGIERGKPQKLAFEVRKAFNVKLICERANKDGACLPGHADPHRVQRAGAARAGRRHSAEERQDGTDIEARDRAEREERRVDRVPAARSPKRRA